MAKINYMCVVNNVYPTFFSLLLSFFLLLSHIHQEENCLKKSIQPRLPLGNHALQVVFGIINNLPSPSLLNK